MKKDESKTINRIFKVAEKEFLEKGFRGASLRNIVKNAGVTTGAFYGYYKSKEELFDALVDTQATKFMNAYMDIFENFSKEKLEEEQLSMDEYRTRSIQLLLKYAYEDLRATKLLLCASDGTKYQDFIHQMVEKEILGTKEYMEKLGDLGKRYFNISDRVHHILVSGMFSSFFELIIHDTPYEEAEICVKQIMDFYIAGWEKLIGISLH